MIECVMCGSAPLVLIGKLGNLTWLRCQACGAEQSAELDEADDE